jgi:hypothetical protein
VRRTMLVLAFLVGTVALPLPASAAAAATCGATLTTDSYLDRDLRCATGLTLTDGVTLDLRGHRLIGPGSGRAVSVLGEGQSITVLNGRITGWATGIGSAVNSFYDGVVTVRGVTFSRVDVGIAAYLGRFVISDSRFVDSGTGVGAFLGHTTITSSVFARNRTGVAGTEDTPLFVTDSTFTDHEFAVDAEGATIVRSTLRHGIVGIGPGSVVRDSTIAYFTTAMRLPGSVRGTALAENTRFIGNRTAIPIASSGTQAVIRNNTFRDNVDAITVAGDVEVLDVTIEGNTFTRNGNGILGTAQPTVRVGSNVARDNIGWGINLPGAVDLGGNTARGNGRTPQCAGVVCPARS